MAQVNGTTYDLSEEFLLECTSGSNDCGGGVVQFALSHIQQNGMPTEAAYPYTASSTASGRPTTAGICSANDKVQHNVSYILYSLSSPATDEEMKTGLNIGTMAVGINADSGFQSYSSGIYSCAAPTTNHSDINHAVQLIGYDANGDWIIKNSWGTSWGIEGFGYVTSDSAGNCGINLEVYRLYGRQLMGWLAISIAVMIMV